MNRLARFADFFSRRTPHDSATAETDAQTRPEEMEAEAVAVAVEVEVEVERMDAEELREPIIASLRGVHDPEIPVNIYDLGLIYRIDIAPNGNVAVDMTLTAPGCPVAGMMPMMVKSAVERVEGVGQVSVQLVWDPPWNADNMSDEARLQLGLM